MTALKDIPASALLSVGANTAIPTGLLMPTARRLAQTATSGAQTLPTATLTVASTVGFAPSGTIQVKGQTVTYSGTTSTTFTGCSGGSGSIADASVVTNCPPGFLVCAGATVKSADYPALDAMIGAAAGGALQHCFNNGSSPGAGTFRLPNLIRCFPFGKTAAGTGSVIGGGASGTPKFGDWAHTHAKGGLTIPAHRHPGDSYLTASAHSHPNNISDSHGHGIASTNRKIIGYGGKPAADTNINIATSAFFITFNTSNAAVAGSYPAVTPTISGYSAYATPGGVTGTVTGTGSDGGNPSCRFIFHMVAAA